MKSLADLQRTTQDVDALTQPHVLAHLLNEMKNPALVHNLVSRFATWTDLVKADHSDVLATAGNAALHVRNTTPPALDLPVATVTTTRYDHTYPQQLFDSPTPPVLLYSTGPLPTVPCVAIIGPLYATSQASMFAKDAAASAVVRNIPVVAVLDETGVGSVALETVCELGGTPIAVISGDVASSHLRSELASRVQNAGGVCVSDTHPKMPWSSVHTMIAGGFAAAYASVVVACDPGLHPAGGSVGVRAAIEMSRPLIVPNPPSMVTTQSFGTHLLTTASVFSVEMFGTNPGITARVAAGEPAAHAVPTTPAEIDQAIVAHLPTH